jgi:hypothetical protein
MQKKALPQRHCRAYRAFNGGTANGAPNRTITYRKHSGIRRPKGGQLNTPKIVLFFIAKLLINFYEYTTGQKKRQEVLQKIYAFFTNFAIRLK